MKIRLDEYEFLGHELCQSCRELASRTGIPVWPDLFRMFVTDDDSAGDVVCHALIPLVLRFPPSETPQQFARGVSTDRSRALVISNRSLVLSPARPHRAA